GSGSWSEGSAKIRYWDVPKIQGDENSFGRVDSHESSRCPLRYVGRRHYQPASPQRNVRIAQVNQAAIVIEKRADVSILLGDVLDPPIRLQCLPRYASRKSTIRCPAPLHRCPNHFVRFSAKDPKLLAVIDEWHA